MRTILLTVILTAIGRLSSGIMKFYFKLTRTLGEENLHIVHMKKEMINQRILCCRRLCPDMSFFQSPTQFPNKYIIDKEIERLHTRVSQVVLSSSVVERRGLGLTKVTNKHECKKITDK